MILAPLRIALVSLETPRRAERVSVQAQGGRLGRGHCGRRFFLLLGTLAALLTLSAGPSVPRASAETPPEKTDVMFVFDTSGSMSGELGEAKEKILQVVEHVRSTLPNVAFGVANVEDIPGYEEGHLNEAITEQQYAESSEKPWRLDQPVSTEASAAASAIQNLTIGGGGDGPEAYSRALWETNTNPTVGWRPNARHEIVLVADNVPHDPNLNEGLPESEWVANPFDTHEEPGGKWGIPDTQWSPGVNLGIRSVAAELGSDGKPLESVEFYGAENGYLHYWEYWAGLSGGEALNGTSGELETRLISVIETGATKALPACPSGEARNAEGVCASAPPPPPLPPCCAPPSFVKLLSLSTKWVLGTRIPSGVLAFPMRLAIKPKLTLSGRAGGPSLLQSDDGSPFPLKFSNLEFDVLDFNWHVASTGAVAAGPTGNLAPSLHAALGLPSAGTDESHNLILSEELASLDPVGNLQYQVPLPSPPSPPGAVAQFQIAPELALEVELYVNAAVEYIGEKLAESAAEEVLSAGLATPLIVGEESVEVAFDLAGYATDIAQKISEIGPAVQFFWKALTDGVNVSQLAKQILTAMVPQLVGNIAGVVSKALKHAVQWVANGVVHTVSAIYSGGKWVISTAANGVKAVLGVGGQIIGAGGSLVSGGIHWVSGIKLSTQVTPAPGFQTGTLSTLTVRSLRSATGLGFGSKLLTRAGADRLAHALVKYHDTKATIRPLLVNRLTVHGGQSLSAVGGHFSNGGTAVIELSGPGGYRAEKLIRTSNGAGGAQIKLPAKMKVGVWLLGILDYHPTSSNKPVLLDGVALVVPKSKQHLGKAHHRP